MWAPLLPFWRGIEGLCFDRGTRQCGGSEVGVSPVSVTFEPCQVLLWTWHGVKGGAVAVNEAEHTTGIVYGTARGKGYEGVRWV